MMLRSLRRTGSNSAPIQKTGWLRRNDNRQMMSRGWLSRHPAAGSAARSGPGSGNTDQCLHVEGIEVSADNTYMYCKGCVRSRGKQTGSDVVVAVEWLDEDRKALNTDWKRIVMQLEGKAVPLMSDTPQPFTVRAPLDRRVKWVQAYAFSGNR